MKVCSVLLGVKVELKLDAVALLVSAVSEDEGFVVVAESRKKGCISR